MCFKCLHFGHTEGQKKNQQKKTALVCGDLLSSVYICIRLHLGAENLVDQIVASVVPPWSLLKMGEIRVLGIITSCVCV